jgi:hypothetical protein
VHGIHEAACLCIHVGTPLMIFMCNLEYRSESISVSISIDQYRSVLISINQNQSHYTKIQRRLGDHFESRKLYEIFWIFVWMFIF